MQIGWLSGMTEMLQTDQSPVGRPLSSTEVAWVASVQPLVSIFSSWPYSWLVDRYGRKLGIITIGLAQAISWTLCLPVSLTCLILSRVVCGIASGGCFNIIPMYIKEISQTNMRGVLGSLLIQGMNIGILIMYAMGAYLDYYLLLYIIIAIPILNAVLMWKASESPVYLAKIGKNKEAAATISYLRGLEGSDEVIRKEMDAIKQEDDAFKSIPNINFLSIFRNKAWRKSFIIMGFLMIFRGANGSTVITSYASSILRASGVTVNPELQTISFPIFMIVGSFVAMICVERLGRKIILSFTLVICVVSLAGLGAASCVQRSGGSVPGWVAVVLLVVSQFGFSAGASPLPLIILAEIFNFQIRAKMMGILTTISWFSTFAVSLAFGPAASYYGVHALFFCFAGINICAIVATVFLPETKGKTIKEIENDLLGNKAASVCT